jgi:hypothetical protein
MNTALGQSMLIGLIIAIIGIISYFLYESVRHGRGNEDSPASIFWGMTASTFAVGTVAAFCFGFGHCDDYYKTLQ